MDWSRHGLTQIGFRGFLPFLNLPASDVPNAAGVYVVLRPHHEPPTFLPRSPAGHFKSRDPSVSEDVLREAWVYHTGVVYIGKATPGRTGRRGLRTRLNEYRRYGVGEPVAHQGGRYIWQLADAASLLVAWCPTPDEDPADVESRLITQFIQDFGVRPFANRVRGRRVD